MHIHNKVIGYTFHGVSHMGTLQVTSARTDTGIVIIFSGGLHSAPKSVVERAGIKIPMRISIHPDGSMDISSSQGLKLYKTSNPLKKVLEDYTAGIIAIFMTELMSEGIVDRQEIKDTLIQRIQLKLDITDDVIKTMRPKLLNTS